MLNDSQQKAVLDALYSARWALTQAKAGKSGDYLNHAQDEVTEAIGVLTGKPVEAVSPGGKIITIEPKPVAAPATSTPAPNGFEYKEPNIVMLDIRMKQNGAYRTSTGKPRGLVVHFTAGHLSPDAKQVTAMLKNLGERGLGCMGMAEDGTIYVPKAIGFTKWASHAGASSWKGLSGVSALCMGMEICNPGPVEKVGNDFFAWWDMSGKNPKKGAKALDPARVRFIEKNTANQKKGYYFSYTPEQELALINFCLWQKKENPEFSFDWVVGHDEVAPQRKSDPGGCLSMTMPDFRNLLKSI
jgi:N-acetyl-anhydromuramyl-L-alanine amidase AmpD